MSPTNDKSQTLTTTSLEVLLAKAFLKTVAGEAYTDDIMDEIIKEENEKRKVA